MIFAFGLLTLSPDTIVVSPYLQNATPSSIVVAWETKGTSTECVVEYGTTEKLGQFVSGSSQTTVSGRFSQARINADEMLRGPDHMAIRSALFMNSG